MADVAPIPVLRPAPNMAARVAALPYDVVETQEARQIIGDNPWSFLAVEKPEATLPEGTLETDPAVHDQAAANLQKLVDEGALEEETTPRFYVYRLGWGYHRQQGLVAGASVEDYRTGIIRRHEHTRKDKEEDRVQHINTCGAHTGAVYLAFADANNRLATLLERVAQAGPPLYDFTGSDGVHHQVWAVTDDEVAQELHEAMHQVGPAYVADGHHRLAAAERVARETGEPQAQRFLAAFFPAGELKVLPYNRVMCPLPLADPASLPDQLDQAGFAVEEAVGGEPVWPERKGEFGLFVRGRWYRSVWGGPRPQDPVEDLDVSLLQNLVLEPLLGVRDPRSDERLKFLGGNRSARDLEQAAGEDGAAFTLKATRVEDVMRVADADGVMPPKSTWFEPKLLSGLFVHRWR